MIERERKLEPGLTPEWRAPAEPAPDLVVAPKETAAEPQNPETRIGPAVSETRVEQKSDKYRQIEAILAAGEVLELYQALSNQQKEFFRRTGEAKAEEILNLVNQPEIEKKLGEIVKIIIDWLKIIPDLNILFVEQEAQIKATEIINRLSSNQNLTLAA